MSTWLQQLSELIKRKSIHWCKAFCHQVFRLCLRALVDCTNPLHFGKQTSYHKHFDSARQQQILPDIVPTSKIIANGSDMCYKAIECPFWMREYLLDKWSTAGSCHFCRPFHLLYVSKNPKFENFENFKYEKIQVMVTLHTINVSYKKITRCDLNIFH